MRLRCAYSQPHSKHFGRPGDGTCKHLPWKNHVHPKLFQAQSGPLTPYMTECNFLFLVKRIFSKLLKERSSIIVEDYTLRVSFRKYRQRLEGICEMVFIPNLGAFHKLIIEASQNKGRSTLGNSQCVRHFHTLIFMPSALGVFCPPPPFFFSYCSIVNSVLLSSPASCLYPGNTQQIEIPHYGQFVKRDEGLYCRGRGRIANHS